MSGNLTSRRRTSPSLNALRAFEATARLGRVGLAAHELNVTHGAVSRQVRLLEESLGVDLFTGPKHHQRLTRDGAALAERLSEGFEIIEGALAVLSGAGAPLLVACHPSVAAKWLIPRLPSFTRAHPEVRLSLLDLAPGEVTARAAKASIRMMAGEVEPELVSIPFVKNHVGLVCAPTLAEGLDAVRLDEAPRLVSETRHAAFAEWAALGGRALAPREPIRFGHLHIMIDAALAGLGVAVAPFALVADDMARGRLVAPFGFVAAPGDFALIRSRRARDPGLKALEAWLVSEGARMPSPPMDALAKAAV